MLHRVHLSDLRIRSRVASVALVRRLRCGTGSHPASPLQPGADGRVEVLQVRAVLSSDGTAVQRKHPLDWKRRTRPQSIALSDGSLCLRIRFTDGRVKEIPFDAYVQGDTINGAKLFGGFTLEIPVPDNLQVADVEVARKGRSAPSSGRRQKCRNGREVRFSTAMSQRRAARMVREADHLA